MLGQLTRQDEADRGLDLTRGDGGLLVVGGKLGGLSGNALEDVWMAQLDAIHVETRRENDSPLTKEFRMDMARLEIPVSGWTCLRTEIGVRKHVKSRSAAGSE